MSFTGVRTILLNGFAAPGSCPVAGMIAGTVWVRPGYMLRYGWLASLAGLITLAFIAYPLWSAMFPYISG